MWVGWLVRAGWLALRLSHATLCQGMAVPETTSSAQSSRHRAAPGHLLPVRRTAPLPSLHCPLGSQPASRPVPPGASPVQPHFCSTKLAPSGRSGRYSNPGLCRFTKGLKSSCWQRGPGSRAAVAARAQQGGCGGKGEPAAPTSA